MSSRTLRHPALFYQDMREYLAGTVPFVRAALEGGEPVAVAVPAPRLDAIATALGEDAGRVTLIDMAEAGRNPGRIIPGVLAAFADAHPDRRVRIIGEPIWPERAETEYPACAQHEALINMAFAGRDVTILCPYDVKGLTAPVLADAAANHPVIVDADGERTSPDFAPQKVLDAHNVPLDDDRPAGTALMFSAESVNVARAYAVARAERAGMPRPRVAQLEVVVSELASNSVIHGGGHGRLHVWLADGHLICQVRDAGVLTDPLAGRRRVDPEAPRGRGLLVVNHLADLVRTHTGAAGGTTIRAYFRL